MLLSNGHFTFSNTTAHYININKYTEVNCIQSICHNDTTSKSKMLTVLNYCVPNNPTYMRLVTLSVVTIIIHFFNNINKNDKTCLHHRVKIRNNTTIKR